MQSRLAVVPVAAAAAVAVCLLAAGCGDGSAAPAVASLGSSTTAAATTAQAGSAAGGPSAGAAPAGAPRQGFGLTLRAGKTADAAKFSSCMRSHGVPNFPDPNGQGAIEIGPSSGIDPGTPAFQAAQRACQKVLPNGGQPTPQQEAKAKQQMLAFSTCMRSHGVSSFPDPTFSGGHIQLSIRGGAGSGLDPSSPTFQAAQQACQSHLPGKIGGGPGGK